MKHCFAFILLLSFTTFTVSALASPGTVERWKLMSQSASQIIGARLRAHLETSPISLRRHLAGHLTCVPEVIYEGDNTTIVTFGDQFKPICDCEVTEPDIVGSLDNYTGSPNVDQVTEFLVNFNAALNGSTWTQENTCLNECAACFDGWCGKKESTELTTFTSVLNRPLNFFDVVDFLFENRTDEETEEFFGSMLQMESFEYSTRDCYDFVAGPETGLVCIAFILSYSPTEPIPLNNVTYDFDLSDVSPECRASVRGEDCNSCVISSSGCVTVDCTNRVPNARPDTCATIDPASTFTGILEPMYFFNVEEEAFAEAIMDGNATANCIVFPMDDSAAPHAGIMGALALLVLTSIVALVEWV